jgi:N-succinyldiaminopimelate aminotransferase
MTVARPANSASGGTTIFTEITELATRTGAINLGQGFPDRDGPPAMLAAVNEAILAGHNQYPPLGGVPVLREAVAEQRAERYGTRYRPADEILVTVGATEGITAAVLALAGAGDEVVVFEPFYDSYAAAIELAGAVRRPVLLHPGQDGFRFDEAELRAAVGPRTRLLIVNSPHNPTGKVFSPEEMRVIASVCQERDLTVVADEVYEYLCFDGLTHTTMTTIPGMAERTIAVSSAAKTFNATGWKVGWLCGPAELVTKVRNVKQYLTFAGGTPFQHAVAVALRERAHWVDALRADLQGARDIMVNGLRDAGVRIYPSQGTYFVQADARSFGYEDSAELCRALPSRAGVAAIPSSIFFDSTEVGRSLVRLAFCKKHAVITEAVSRLGRFVRDNTR